MWDLASVDESFFFQKIITFFRELIIHILEKEFYVNVGIFKCHPPKGMLSSVPNHSLAVVPMEVAAGVEANQLQ
jgi:hypothetical protein